jgi:hypothetical protein
MLASGIAVGFLAGWLAGGRPSRLADLQISWWPILLVALALRFAAPSLGESFALWLVSFAAIAAIALINYRIPGMWLIAAGASLNLLIVLLDQGMPVDVAAANVARAEIAPDGLHRALRDTDALALFADRIPVPGLARVYSVGDLLLAVGGFWVPFARMRGR